MRSAAASSAGSTWTCARRKHWSYGARGGFQTAPSTPRPIVHHRAGAGRQDRRRRSPRCASEVARVPRRQADDAGRVRPRDQRRDPRAAGQLRDVGRGARRRCSERPLQAARRLLRDDHAALSRADAAAARRRDPRRASIPTGSSGSWSATPRWCSPQLDTLGLPVEVVAAASVAGASPRRRDRQ